MSLRHLTLLTWLIIGLVVILYAGKFFLLPVALGSLLAILFNPLASRLQRGPLPDWLAVSLCLQIGRAHV
jgi:predicted PurR-regulated permease PerM